MSRQQLTLGERYQISTLLSLNFSQTEIGQQIGRDKSVISRELSRNRRIDGFYDPALANQLVLQRRPSAQKRAIPKSTVFTVEYLLQHDWSPEQISSTLTGSSLSVSHEWIYQYVAKDKKNGGQLYKHLRQGHKKYRRRHGIKRTIIQDSVSIDERPKIVDERARVGDWEIDTVIGKQGTGAIVTIVERETRFFLAKKVIAKSAKAVEEATIELLKPFASLVHTITADNGIEFANHKAISEALGCSIYFAHPYCSWERGANENSNGLLRQYIPKGKDLREVTDE